MVLNRHIQSLNVHSKFPLVFLKSTLQLNFHNGTNLNMPTKFTLPGQDELIVWSSINLTIGYKTTKQRLSVEINTSSPFNYHLRLWVMCGLHVKCGQNSTYEAFSSTRFIKRNLRRA